MHPDIFVFLIGFIAIQFAYWMRYRILPVFSASLLGIGVLLTATYTPTILALAIEWGRPGKLLAGALLFSAGLCVTFYLWECQSAKGR